MMNETATLIGRRAELATLRGRLQDAGAGRAGVVLVGGEPGIGKTHLLGAFEGEAARAGCGLLRGGASDAEGMPPYLPFIEALGRHVRAVAPDRLRAQVGPDAPILATILPELALRLGELPASYPLPPEQARLRLFEAVGAWLTAIATEQPALLVLDDLHWADAASLDLLCHVARHQPDARLLIVGAYRQGEAQRSQAFTRAIAELNRLRVLSTVTLGPLAAEECAGLAEGYLGGSLEPAAVATLFARSEGNPFFAEELLRGWLEAEALAAAPLQDGTRTYHLDTGRAPAMPAGIAGAIGQRIARLSPEVVELLRTAAIIGRTFDVELLAEVAGQEPEPVELGLREAEVMRLLRGDAGGRFTFSHDTVRECLYQEVTSVRRRLLHGLIGRALEATQEPADAQRLAELAFHYARSGDRERGVSHTLRAAADAARASAPDEALALYRTALGLLTATDPRRGDALAGLGEAALLTGAVAETVDAFSTARDWFERAGDRPAAARAMHRLGHAWWRQERIAEARQAFEGALAWLEDGTALALVPVLVDLGSLLAVSEHRLAEGIVHVRRAVEVAQHGDGRAQAMAYRALGNLLVRSNDLAAGIPLLERALAVATASDDSAEAAECCSCLATAYFWCGDADRSHAITRQRLALAERSRDPYELRHAYTWLAVTDGIHGRWSECTAWMERAQVAVDRLGSPEPQAYLSFCHGAFAYYRGDWPAADVCLRETMALFRGMGPGALIWYLGMTCLVHAALGQIAAAHAAMDELEGLVAMVPEGTMPTSEPLAYLTETALVLGERGRLDRYYPRLQAFEGQFHDFIVDRLMGEVELMREEWDRAEAHLAAAEAAARREALPWELARTLRARARLVLAQDRRRGGPAAQALLAEAEDILTRLGNAPELAQVRRERGGVAPPGRRAALPAGLSERETDVLRLVAAGKGNREIAAALVVSEKTVESHLTSIYSKIGADNRAAAAAFAIRHGLA